MHSKKVEVIFSIFLLLLFAASSVWAQNATWVGTTGDINTATNWNPAGVPSGGFTYTFDNTGITTTITGNPASGILIVVNSAAGVKDYTLSGILSGATTVTKNGTSTLVLSGANTYSGVTNVNAGILNIQNNTALGTSASGTVVANGARLQLQNNIMVAGEPLTLNGTNPISATGGVITTSGNNVIHTFTSSGTFTMTSGGMVDYLVVGGGGGGSGGSSGGGGGGGGVLTGNILLAASSYPVTVGSGGSGGTVASNPIWAGMMGSNSTFAGLVAYGGGGGGDGFTGDNMNGASGGGSHTGGEVSRATYTSAGSAIYGAQGNNGGRGFKNKLVGGGGGGAGSAGLDGSMTKAGDGGSGIASSISGTALFYGGGGGGGGQTGSAPATRGIGGSGVSLR